MRYLIDERGIHYFVEDAEADRVAELQAERSVVNDPNEIPLPDAICALRDISAWIERLGNES